MSPWRKAGDPSINDGWRTRGSGVSAKLHDFHAKFLVLCYRAEGNVALIKELAQRHVISH
jgi:hypothetical protein